MDVDAIVPIAETTRNGVVESIHHGVVVALAADGTTHWSAGDPTTAVYPRSALKPLQAQALVDAGLALDQDELAVACGSHGGEAAHLQMVRRILAKFGLNESALGNTPALPLSKDAAAAVVRSGAGPTALLQNCSGKHAAMLALCVVKRWPLDDYLDVEHPVQRLVHDYLSAAAGGVCHTGTDGCGAPTATVSLVGLARAVRALAIENAVTFTAMTKHPDLVDREGGGDTSLMRAVPGLVAKGGAEAVYVAAHADGRAVALKVADGSDRAKLSVMVAALRSLGFDVDGVTLPPILGHARPVGEVRALVGDC